MEIKLRSYQSLLIEHAIQENSIIYLPTGAGKTFIAIEVIKHFARDIEKSFSDGGKRTVFMVNTNALAIQQAAVLSSALPYNVGLFTGEKGVDTWDKNAWQNHLDKYQIIVATTQVILDGLNHRFVDLNNFNLMVFDECHKATKEHPMHEVMKQFTLNENIENPRVLGLSGILLSSTVEKTKIRTELQKLESTLLAKIKTVNNIEDHKNVLLYSTNPNETFIDCNSSQFTNDMEILSGVFLNIRTYLSSMNLPNRLNQHPKTLRQQLPKPFTVICKLFDSFKTEMQEIGLAGAVLCLLSLTIELELMKKNADSKDLQQICSYCITAVEMLSHLLYNYMDHDNLTADQVLQYCSPKVRSLICTVKEKFNNPTRDPNLQCIIFVQRRFTAKVLFHLFKEYATLDKDFPIIPDFVIGRSGSTIDSIENILASANFKKALAKFAQHETNCMFSSSVLEEGIDIQSCNLVIMFDKPETYTSYVQTKGRARHKTSDYIVLLNNDELSKFLTKKAKFDGIDAELKAILIEKTIDRLEIDEISIEKERQYEWPPYITQAGARLTGLTAISVLHRYANTLPNDLFTNVNIFYNRIDEDKRTKVGLTLPNQSKVKEEIWSDFMDNVKIAKQLAAFRACVKLHQLGELDDNLMPVEISVKIEPYDPEYFSHWKKYEEQDAKQKNVGISKRRVHKMEIPDEITDCAPQVGTNCYLYPIRIIPKFTTDVETLKVFLKLYKNSTTYGILTTKKIPKLSAMRFFKSYGEINVTLDHQPITICLNNSEQIKLLQNFHIMIFRDILQTWQSFFVFEFNSYLVVPLENDAINWNLVSKFQKLDAPSFYDKSVVTVIPKPEDIQYKVITPYYRNQYDIYMVTHVREYMTPLSEFPSDRSPTYKDYFEKTYDVTIRDPNQYLVEVHGIGRNMNLLFPGEGFAGRKRRVEREVQEFYVPEICYNFDFPGDYWLKAVLLPIILHRMYYLLLAERLRMYLLEEVGIGSSGIPQKFELDVDYGSLERRRALENEYLKYYKSHYGVWATYEEMMKRVKESVDENKHIRFIDNALIIDDTAKPIDLDRNWTKITQLDIDNYVRYCHQNINMPSPIHVGSSPPRMETDDVLLPICNRDSKKIRIIQLRAGFCETPQQKDLIKILTTSKSADVFDMERFEVLGDCFLKLTVSLFLYKSYPDWHEGYLTCLKGKIVSNKNLFYCGNDFGIPGKIKFLQFQPTCDWMPPCAGLPKNVKELLRSERFAFKALDKLKLSASEVETGNLSDENMKLLHDEIMLEKEADEMFQESSRDDNVDVNNIAFLREQYFKDKVVADCMEALIGVCVNSVGLQGSMKLLKHFKILPENKDTEHLLNEQIAPRTLRQNYTQNDVLRLLINREKCENIIGYTFKDRSYLLQAMTHPTYPTNNITGCYQELEFIGDAILDFLITSYIFEQCSEMDPGKLTDLRSALVNNVTLGCIVVRHDLHKFLLAQNHLLAENIANFVQYQEANNFEITEQIEVLVSEDDNEAVASSIEVPKVLGDLFESIVGAIYLDSGMNLEVTWTAIYGLMEKELLTFMKDVPKQLVRRLFEYPGAEPKFYKPEKIGEKVYIPLTFNINTNDTDYVIGIGNNVKSAKKAASKVALRKLYKNSNMNQNNGISLKRKYVENAIDDKDLEIGNGKIRKLN